MREFSGFLAPRWGFFEVETWTAIVSLLAGLVPALLIGLSVIGVTLIAWLSLTFPLASQRSDAAPALVIGIVTILVLALFEDMWQQFRRETAGYASARTPAEIEASNRGRRRHLTFAALAVGIVVDPAVRAAARLRAEPRGDLADLQAGVPPLLVAGAR